MSQAASSNYYSRLEAMVIALAGLLLAFCLFPPRFDYWNLTGPFDYENIRFVSGILPQQVDPFRVDVEEALRFRWLYPGLGALFNLNVGQMIVLPWMGAWFFLSEVYLLLCHETSQRRIALGAVLILATSSGCLTTLHWLGYPDAWYLWAIVLLQRRLSSLYTGIVLIVMPWMDEKFILALAVLGCVLLFENRPGDHRRCLLFALTFLGYGVIRTVCESITKEHTTVQFLGHFLKYSSNWWIVSVSALLASFRAGWVVLPGLLHARFFNPLFTVGFIVVVALLSFVIDLSRTFAIFTPIILLGLSLLGKTPKGARWIALACLLNLLFPALQVTSGGGSPYPSRLTNRLVTLFDTAP